MRRIRREAPRHPRSVATGRGVQRRLALAIGCAAALLSATTAAGFELDEILGRPVLSGVVAAEEAPRIAWIEQQRGARSLWTAAAPEFEPLRLTAYEGDDGRPLGSLRLTPDGSVLVWVRGSAPNAAGEVANPDSDPRGAERAIWAVSTAGGEPWKVAAGGAPLPTPDGRSVVWASGGEVLAAPLRPERESGEAGADGEGGSAAETPEPTTLLQARGGIGELVFSPDGRRLAFVSDRGDHAFVGVFDREAGTITWMAPSVDRDGAPAFSPDGSRIAFLRQPGRLIGERFDLTSGRPFSILVGDPASGAARVIWSSPGADGGFAQYYPSTPLAWAGDERLVFTSEHGGWHHAFAVDAEGGEARDLSPGEAEIEELVLSPDGETVYFWGNHADVDRRHLWRVPSAGGEPLQLTSGDGIEVEPVPLAGGELLALRFADARRPMAVGLVPAEGGEIRRVAPAAWPEWFPADELVEPRPVVLEAADGLEIHGQLFSTEPVAVDRPMEAQSVVPAEADGREVPGASEPPAASRRPAVIFLHGGPIRQMLLGWHYRGYYANAYAFNQYLASRGYVVLALNFRTGIGYGRAFRQAEEQGPRGASEYQDVVAAGEWLAARPDVDPGRIGLWGGSYGGLLTAMGLARDSELFAAGVDLHGVHDWAFRATDLPTPGGGWGLTDDDLELARRSSPVADVDDWRSPVLLVHGDDDRNVLFAQTTDLVQRLRDRDVHVELLVFPDEVHGFYRYASWKLTFDAAADFFERFLRGGA